ncbi:MAG TPA: DUF4177 domain-containing protein [Chloroflexaceae bacterium]|nr:DUF4177 domain-containing protein [Chloroflexaceae bacterium]
MDKWEYRTIYISWKELKDSRGKKYNEWVVEFSDGTRLEGLSKILSPEGKNGWELVNILSEYSEPVNHWGGNNTKGYRAFFKRKLKEAAS